MRVRRRPYPACDKSAEAGPDVQVVLEEASVSLWPGKE